MTVKNVVLHIENSSTHLRLLFNPYKKQEIDLQRRSIDWFQYEWNQGSIKDPYHI